MAESRTWEADLCTLLRDSLFADELGGFRDWLSRWPDGREILPNLPGPAASLAETVAEALRLLRNRGLIDSEFFHRLIVARPRRRTEIANLMKIVVGEHPGFSTPKHIADREDDNITEMLIGGEVWARLTHAGSESSSMHPILALSSEQTGEWVLDSPFSPSLVLQIGPRAELFVPAPHYLSYQGVRKGQNLNLERGATEVILTQAQPSVRQATLRVHRGISRGSLEIFSIGPNLGFVVDAGLPGRVLALSGPPAATPSLLVVWFEDLP